MKSIHSRSIDSLVKQYIVDCIDFDALKDYEFATYTADRVDNLAAWVLMVHNSEFGFVNKERYPANRIIGEWLQGLPSVINIDFEYCSIMEKCIEWGCCDENYSDKEFEVLTSQWFYVMGRKLEQIANGYNIKGLKFTNPHLNNTAFVQV